MTINVIYSPGMDERVLFAKNIEGNAYHMSRKEIIEWVNDTLFTNIVKIGDLGEGSHYCQLLDMIFPDCVKMKNVKWNCKHEIDKINNYKVLQEAFKYAEIDKIIPINDLTKKRYREIRYFLFLSIRVNLL